MERDAFYFQFAFVLDRMKAMAPQHPEWKDNPLYTAVLANDMKTVAAGGDRAILKLAMITHAGMTTDEFEKIVEDWITNARHPKFNRPYTDLILSANARAACLFACQWLQNVYRFRWGIEFMRTLAEQVYGFRPSR